MYGYYFSDNLRNVINSTPNFNKTYCSYYLNGTDSYLQGTTTTTDLVGGTGKTWSVRIVFRRLRVATQEYLFGNFQVSGNLKQFVGTLNVDNTLTLTLSSDGSANSGNYKTVKEFNNTTDFYDLILTYNNGVVTCFVDGVADAGTSTTIPTTVYNNALPTTYGTTRLLTAPFKFFEGYYNQVGWTNDVITSTEAATLNNSGSPRITSDVLDNMVQQYIFDNDTFDGTDWTLLDSVSTNDGISVNVSAIDKDCNENPY